MSDTMARKPKLPWKRRVQEFVADLFAEKSAIRVPDATELPAGINKRNNADVQAFHVEHDVFGEYALANTLKQAAEAWHKKARAKVMEVLEIDEFALEPGTEDLYTRDNVSVLIKVSSPQMRLDRESLRLVLMRDLKLTAEGADEVIRKSEKPGKAPVLLTPTVNG